MPEPDLSFLPPARRAAIHALLAEFIATVPGLRGFLVHGSAWNSARQLPEADVDLNWVGDVAEDADARLGHRRFFLHQGIPIDCSSYWVGDLTRPRRLSLVAVLSLQRGHIAWERAGCFSGPRAATADRLGDRAWIADKVAGHLGWARGRLAAWQAEIAEHGAARWGWSSSTVWGLPSLSPGLLRPPSAARKGLMEIVDCSRRLGLGWYGEAVLAAIGVDSLDEAEVAAWCERMDGWYRSAAAADPTSEWPKHAYHVAGMRALIAQGWHREAIWILHRALGDLEGQFAEGAPLRTELTAARSELAERLGHTDRARLLGRLERAAAAMDELTAQAEAIAAGAAARWHERERALPVAALDEAAGHG